MKRFKSLASSPCFLAFFLFGIAAASGLDENQDTVFSKADPLWRPADVPRASDVIMRSLLPRVEDEGFESIRASRDFHVTRHEWTYLNYLSSGGDLETSREFIEEAHAMGMPVGAAGSGSSHHVERFTDQEREEYCVLELDGKLYTPPHKRGWRIPPGQGSVFSDEYFRIHLEHYLEQIDLGATIAQRDEVRMSTNPGYDFNPAAIAAFRDYLQENSTREERMEWGIEPLDEFDVREYFIDLGVPEDPSHHHWFHSWRNEDPVKRIYSQFITDGVVDFYRRTRAELNRHAGRVIPFSCNNTSLQLWQEPMLEYDWAMSELMFRTANPRHLHERFREGMEWGKVQVLSTPKPIGEVSDPESFRKLNRQVIAQAYSLGGLCKAPWDLFLQTKDGRGRYFGDPAHYADLYGFVRGMAPYLEDYEEAAVYGKNMKDVHGWQAPPLRLEGNDDVYAFLRVRPRDPSSPVVIHLVNWSQDMKNMAPVTVQVRKDAIEWDEGNRIVLAKTPTEYNEDLHRWVDRKAETLRPDGQMRGPDEAPAYQMLVETTVLTPEFQDGWVLIPDVVVDPWTVLVIDSVR